uniref:Uncharacterized protein n=1 Tax=Tetradesmus obliquus TaxID=3088 RepID=A0A383W650_TETOB
MIPSLRGVQRQRLSPGVFGHQQQCVQQQHLLLSTPSRRSASKTVARSLVQSNRLVNTPADHAAASIQQREAAPQAPHTFAGSTAAAAEPDDLTAAAEHALLHGNGLARAILSDPGIEGDPLAFLKATEAYWKALKQQKHDPHKKGPTVITTSSQPFAALLPAANTSSSSSSSTHSSSSSSSSMRRSPSFGVAPRPAELQHLDDAAAAAEMAAAAAAASSSSSSVVQPDFDVVMCGGVLGIVVALALQRQGFRVAVVEKRLVEGRTQEWNSSRHECQVLVNMGLLSQAELDAAIVSDFNPVRVGFKGGDPLWVQDCLNIGVSPKSLIASLRRRFEAAGGIIYEQTAFKSAVICPDGVVATLVNAADAPAGVGDTNRPNALTKQQQQQQQQQGKDSAGHAAAGSSSSSSSSGAAAAAAGSRRRAPSKLSCRLLLDCMGHYSNIVKQMRGRAKPDGMVLVVGGCATGFPAELNTTADLLTTITDASADMQLFWEAFPADGGASRTTYMFAYSDAEPSRPTFERLLDAYFKLLPAYQGLGQQGLAGLQFKRVLFGGFPCYADSPLKPGFDRVLQLGDASATQSPLSFGGFGTMLRHLPRFSAAIAHALRDGKLSKTDLAWIHPYQPSLSAAMLFQRSMSVGVGQLQPKQQAAEKQQDDARSPIAAAAGNGSTSSSNGNGHRLPVHDSSSSAASSSSITSTFVVVPAGGKLLNGSSSSSSNGHSSSNGYGKSNGSAVHSNSNGRSNGFNSLQGNGHIDGIELQHSSNGNGSGHSNGHSSSNGHSNGGRVHHSSNNHTNGNGAHHSSSNGYSSKLTNGSSNGHASISSSSEPHWTVIGNGAGVSAAVVPTHPTGTTSTTTSSSSKIEAPKQQQPHLNWLQRFALLPAGHINALLGANFGVMLLLGQRVLKPFLQDTLQLLPLGLTMAGMMAAAPRVISRVLLQIGPKMLFGWFGHFAALAAYSLGHVLLSPLRRCSSSYTWHRLLDALQYGSASDYHYAPSAAVSKAEAAALNAKLAAGAAGLANGKPAAVHANHWNGKQQQRQDVDSATVVVPPLGVQQQQQQQLWESPEIVSHLGQQLRYT